MSTAAAAAVYDRRWVRRVVSVLFVGMLLGGGWLTFNHLRQAQAANELPVAPARKGEFLAIVRCRGDIKAGRSVPIYAPVVPNLTIAWMANAGEEVKEGEPIIRFD